MQNATADFSEPVKFQEVNFPYPYCGRSWPSFKEREPYFFFNGVQRRSWQEIQDGESTLASWLGIPGR